jgi:hypothetical protein
MKKLSFNSTLNHMRDGYNTYYVSRYALQQ